jgi:glycogen debranching enzyme
MTGREDRPQVLKHQDTFAVFDRLGDIESSDRQTGLYHQDTRYLSHLTLRLGGLPADAGDAPRESGLCPQLLASAVSDDNLQLRVDLCNPEGTGLPPRGSLHLLRTLLMHQHCCYQQVQIHNYGQVPADFELSLGFDADFADIFEVRGVQRHQHGQRLEPVIRYQQQGHQSQLDFAYLGLDGGLRRTQICFDPPPDRLTATTAIYSLQIAPGADFVCECQIECLEASMDKTLVSGRECATSPPLLHLVYAQKRAALNIAAANTPTIWTNDACFNLWLERSWADLRMLCSETAYGPYPYAGVPWYSTVFGRDGILTALECLWFEPALARGVLGFLAANQAESANPAQDAQPGKILHEFRGGEMASLGEVPYGRYYGSIDATPLFVVLAGAYYRRSGDLPLITRIWPQIVRALEWIDTHGDLDGDGFVEYARQSADGLVNQGWKDSNGVVFHADGRLAEGPIALCEVQAYVYLARRMAALLAESLGQSEQAQKWASQAENLRQRFEAAFWCEELSTYGLALDGHKQLCRVSTSNAGHCLFGGIASPERAQRVAMTLTGPAAYSGWGIRTLATGSTRYNPMSYHNGTIWPHDNALIAAGCAGYGLQQPATRILTDLSAAARYSEYRLPELFCGFDRRPDQGPTWYPVACAPQAWAAGAIFWLLQACLGLEVDGIQNKILLNQPSLPPSLNEVRLSGLGIGANRLDLLLTRDSGRVSVRLLGQQGDLELVHLA